MGDADADDIPGVLLAGVAAVGYIVHEIAFV